MPEMRIEEALEICIEKLNNKTATVAECLAEFPEHASELSELLPLSYSLKNLQGVKPSARFTVNANHRLATKLSDHPVTFGAFVRHIFQKQTYQPTRSFGMSQIIVSIILAVSLLLGGSAAVDASGPGDLLYEIDRSVELIRLRLTGNPEKAAALRVEYATERLEEAEMKLQRGDMENALKAMEAYSSMVDEVIDEKQVLNREEVRTMTQEEGALQAGTLDRIRLSQPEDAQARSAFQKALQRANMGVDALFGPYEGAPQGPSEDVPQGPASDDAQGPTEEAPQAPPEDAPQGPTDGPPYGPKP